MLPLPGDSDEVRGPGEGNQSQVTKSRTEVLSLERSSGRTWAARVGSPFSHSTPVRVRLRAILSHTGTHLVSCLPHRLCFQSAIGQREGALAPPNPHSPFLVQRIFPVLPEAPALCVRALDPLSPETTLQMPGGKGPVEYKETLPGVWVENSSIVYPNIVGLGLQKLEIGSWRAGKQRSQKGPERVRTLKTSSWG